MAPQPPARMRPSDLLAQRRAASLAMRVFLRAWAKDLPFGVRELQNELSPAVPNAVQFSAQQPPRVHGRTTGFRGPRKTPVCWTVFSGEFRELARPSPGNSPGCIR